MRAARGETRRASRPAAGCGNTVRWQQPTTGRPAAAGLSKKVAVRAAAGVESATLPSIIAIIAITITTGAALPLTARADAVHGLRYRYVDGSGRATWAAPVDSCREPSHDVVLRNYSQGEFHEDPEKADNFWGVGNVGEKERRRYLIVRKLAEGAEGATYEAIDRDTGKLVAIKKVSNIFADPKKWLFVAKQILAEVKSLHITRSSPDFMRLNRIIRPRHPHSFDTVYIVLDMLERLVPVASTAAAGDIIEPAAADSLRLRVFQLVRGMAFLHSAGVVHGDLRYHNVMMDDECNIRIIDLGDLVPAEEHQNSKISYFPGTGRHEFIDRDLWMMGTTILTWVGGKDMYLDGTRSDFNHAKFIVSALGFQSEESLANYSYSIQDSFHKAQEWFTESGQMPLTLEERLPAVDPRLFTMVRRIMRLDRKVPSAMELLEDPYFEGLHRRLPVPKGPTEAVRHLMSIWKQCNSVRDARQMIYEEVLKTKYRIDIGDDNL